MTMHTKVILQRQWLVSLANFSGQNIIWRYDCTGLPLQWLCKFWPQAHAVEDALGFC